MAQEPPALSVVILCYKAGGSVVPLVAHMKELLTKRGLSYELILVANYNAGEELSDSTPHVVREIAQADRTITPITFSKKGMFGWDVRSGLTAARGKTIAFIDGDGQMPFIDVIRVYDELIKTRADMVQTFRVKRFDGTQRVFISRVYNVLLRLFFPNVSVYDANAKPKIFTRDALSRLTLTADDWFIDAEIVLQASAQHFIIRQLPTVFLKNERRASFVKISAIFEFMKNLLHYRFKSWFVSV